MWNRDDRMDKYAREDAEHDRTEEPPASDVGSSGLFAMLSEFLELGGMIDEPQEGSPSWELGWNTGPCYAIEANADTLEEAVKQLTPAVIEDMKNTIKAEQP